MRIISTIFIFCLTGGLLALSVHGSEPEPYYGIYDGGDPNSFVGTRPNELQFEPISLGQEIVLNTVIVVPSRQSGQILTVEFSRIDFQPAFIEGLFFADGDIRRHHPFSSPGMESILSKDTLTLSIDSGVILHLRDDMKRFPELSIFANKEALGKVTKIDGLAFYSSDHEKVKTRLQHLFVWYSAPTPGAKFEYDSEYGTIIIPPKGVRYLPNSYPPRIIGDP